MRPQSARQGLRGHAGRQVRGGRTRPQAARACRRRRLFQKEGVQTAGFAALPHGLPEGGAQGRALPGCGALCHAAVSLAGRCSFPFRRVFSRRIVPPRR